MIIVTGASGRLGRAVVEHLLELVPAEEVGVSVRDPERVAGLRARGVRVRRGDYAGLGPSIEGATSLLLVSAPLLGESLLTTHEAAIEAAAAAGVKHVFYTSHMGANPESPFPPMRGHAATERMLAGSGLSHTVLRNGFYANTVSRLMGSALESGELRVPEDGPVAWTTHEDLAAAAARVLVDGAAGGPTPPLTGPAEVDMAEAAAIASRVTGRPIRRVVVPADEFKQGLPEPTATMMAGMFEAARRGEFRPAGPALAGLIGRPATSLEDYLRQVL
ncbi:NAD(P)H-binding protein [Actinoplanes sp. NPDC049596]|uniref:NmrA family NAD(P)-binding protein n=1 Tax=unclassified Actinoplanes TaxID=2626549 RepID=UPI00343C7471